METGSIPSAGFIAIPDSQARLPAAFTTLLPSIFLKHSAFVYIVRMPEETDYHPELVVSVGVMFTTGAGFVQRLLCAAEASWDLLVQAGLHELLAGPCPPTKGLRVGLPSFTWDLAGGVAGW